VVQNYIFRFLYSDAQKQSWLLITLLNKVKSVQKALSSRVSAAVGIHPASVAAAEAIMAPQIFPLTTSIQLANVETRLTKEPNFVAKLVG